MNASINLATFSPSSATVTSENSLGISDRIHRAVLSPAPHLRSYIAAVAELVAFQAAWTWSNHCVVAFLLANFSLNQRHVTCPIVVGNLL